MSDATDTFLKIARRETAYRNRLKNPEQLCVFCERALPGNDGEVCVDCINDNDKRAARIKAYDAEFPIKIS